MNKFYSPITVAKMLEVSRLTVYRWIKSGKLKAVKVGGSVRIREEDLREFIKEK